METRLRIREVGGEALTNIELLELGLRLPYQLACEVDFLNQKYGSLLAIPRHELISVNGIGQSIADAVYAIAEVTRRQVASYAHTRRRINSPGDLGEIISYEMSALEQEQLRVALLNVRNDLLAIAKVYQGSVSTSQIRIADIFKPAVRQNAYAIIVIHNHPSGDPMPSPDDVEVTRAIVQAGKMIEIDVLDHLIIGGGRWVSLKERGYMPPGPGIIPVL